MKKSLTFFLVMVLGLSSSLWASDLTQPANGLYPYRSTIRLQDDFISGTATSGGIGNLNWLFTNGTTGGIAPETNRYGIIQRSTSAVSGTNATLFLFGAVRDFLASTPYIWTWDARLNTNDANTTMRVGVMQDVGSPPSSGSYIEKLDADTNWFCISRNAGVQTRTDSTVAVNTSFNSFKATRNSSGIQFSINNVNVCGLITTNVTSAALFPIAQIVNSAAAAKTMDLDYFQIMISGIAR